MPKSPTQPAPFQPGMLSPSVRRLDIWAYFAGLVVAVVALGAAGALSWQHLTGKSLPGCGGVKHESTGVSLAGDAEESKPACATLEAHPMGSLGGMWTFLQGWSRGERPEKVLPEQAFWPMSYVGTAWFAGVLGAWVVVGIRERVVPGPLRGLIWLGALGSVGYLVAIVLSHKFCQYCITAHSANLALLAFMEIGMRTSRVEVSSSTPAPSAARSRGRLIAPALGAAVFVFTTVGLAFGEHARQQEVASKNASDMIDFSQEFKAKTEREKQQSPVPKPQALPWGNNGFTGRWLLGPKEASVRLVMITDYQCPDCKRNEGEAMAMYAKFPDKISISAMHFPLCSDCNNVSQNMHPNACWAARAAETAGLLQGNDGFWKMHKWLFSKAGSFTNEELTAGLAELGFADTDTFVKIMQTDATLRPIKADIEIGNALGLYFTPLIFINGVEFRAWNQPGKMTEAIQTALAADPPAQGPQGDRPMLAREKYIEDWRVMPVVNIPPARADRTLGKPDAKVHVVVFGDYTDKDRNSRKVDDLLRSWVAKGDKSLSYSFRHYPGDQSCNPSLPKTFFAFDCITAKGAEGAGVLGGADLFWKMHGWLLANGQRITSAAAVREGGASIGIDPSKLESAMNSPEAEKAVLDDIAAAKAAGVTSIPCIYVNGRRVERWSREGDNVLERIVIEAEAGKPAP